MILGIYFVQSYKKTGTDKNSAKENFYPQSDYNDDSPQDSSHDESPHDYPSTYDKPFDDSIFDGPPVEHSSDNSISAGTVPSGEKEDNVVFDDEFPTESSQVDKSVETESPTNLDAGDFERIQLLIHNSVRPTNISRLMVYFRV